MAVTIDEMHVDVKDSQPPASAPAAGGEEPKKDVDLHEAMHFLHERKYRLWAD
jgi:hypothetical protein